MKKNQRIPLKIQDCWLYEVASKKDLARRLSIKDTKFTEDDLKNLSVDKDNFKIFSIKQGDKQRPVQEPKLILQKLHKRVHILLSRIEVPDYLHSAVRGRSYLTNARAHAGDMPVIKIDVKKFFPSVPRVAIYNFFYTTMKCRKDVAGLIADILTFDKKLPTGSSSSPIIAYYAFKLMFDEIFELAKVHGLTMTCYVDDITLSGEKAGKAVLYEARTIIAKYGLRSHKMKSFKAQEPKIITGVCNVPDGERVPNRQHLKIHKGFEDLKNAKTSNNIAKALRPLLGRLEAGRQIDPTLGERAKTLRAQFSADIFKQKKSTN